MDVALEFDQRGEQWMIDKSPRGPAKDHSKSASQKARSRSVPADALGEVIGAQLRAIYDEVVAQPIPDRLLELLSRLDDQAGDK